MEEKILVIGGGIAGLSAAEAARKQNENADIILVSEEKDLPYYRLRLAEVLADPAQGEKLFLKDEAWFKEQNIQVLLGSSLEKIDPEAKVVSLADGRELAYDKLIVATGSRSRQPDLPGDTRPNVFTLWSMADARSFSKAITDYGIKRCAIVGGGVLGLEAAWQLHLRGVKVAILERGSHLLKRQLNPEASSLLQDYIESLGISIYTEADTAEIRGEGDRGPVSGLLLKDGRLVECDAVLFSIGVLANTQAAAEAGLTIGRRITVNSKMETSHKDIYAAGDNAEVDGDYWFGLWPISMKQGKVAGTNAAGGQANFVKETPPYMVNTMKTRIVSQGFLPEEESEDISFRDEIDKENYSYKRLVFKGENLVGFILIGDAARQMVALQKELVEV